MDDYIPDVPDDNYSDSTPISSTAGKVTLVFVMIMIVGVIVFAMILSGVQTLYIALVVISGVLIVVFLLVFGRDADEYRGSRGHVSNNRSYVNYRSTEFIPYKGNKRNGPVYAEHWASVTDSENGNVPLSSHSCQTFNDADLVDVTLETAGEPYAYIFFMDGKKVAILRKDSLVCKMPKGKHKVKIITADNTGTVLYDNEVVIADGVGFSVNKKKVGYSVRMNTSE